MNKIVFRPDVRSRLIAAAMTRRISATLLSTPLSLTNSAFVMSAMTCASVVLPVPGGPEKMTEGNRSASIARRSNLPGARICSCPANSSRDRGRIRVASGAVLSSPATPKRLSGSSSLTKRSSITGQITSKNRTQRPTAAAEAFTRRESCGNEKKEICVELTRLPGQRILPEQCLILLSRKYVIGAMRSSN